MTHSLSNFLFCSNVTSSGSSLWSPSASISLPLPWQPLSSSPVLCFLKEWFNSCQEEKANIYVIIYQEESLLAINQKYLYPTPSGLKWNPCINRDSVIQNWVALREFSLVVVSVTPLRRQLGWRIRMVAPMLGALVLDCWMGPLSPSGLFLQMESLDFFTRRLRAAKEWKQQLQYS